MEESRPSIEILAGEELNGVAFVMDYVDFHFNGPVLRAFSNPVLQSTNQQVEFPNTGSRDALCSLIGSTVDYVELREEEAIRLRFTDGRMLIVPLNEESRIGPEAATFQPGLTKGPLDVW